jgi:hypothetical protein
VRAGVVTGLVVLLLASCATMGARVSDKRLIEIARADAVERRTSLDGLVAEVRRDNSVHSVTFWYPECLPPVSCIGGGVYFGINAKTLRVVSMIPIE